MNSSISYPIAKDENNQWVEIDSAQPKGTYFCPECESPFIVRLGNIRKHHFAHKSGYSDVCTGESGYHFLAKHLLAFYFDKEKTLPMLSRCPKCSRVLGEKKHIIKVEVEKGVNEYRPDVRLTLEGNITVDCEVVFRNPLGDKIASYRENKGNLLIWQIDTSVEKVPPVIQYSWERVSGDALTHILRNVKDNLLFFTPLTSFKHNCSPYGKAEISEGKCWRCGKTTKVASITFWYPRWDRNEKYDDFEQYDGHESWIGFNEIPVGFWQTLNRKYGTSLSSDYSNTTRSYYLMNHCSHCKAKIGDFFLHEYYENMKKVTVEFTLTDWGRKTLEKYKIKES